VILAPEFVWPWGGNYISVKVDCIFLYLVGFVVSIPDEILESRSESIRETTGLIEILEGKDNRHIVYREYVSPLRGKTRLASRILNVSFSAAVVSAVRPAITQVVQESLCILRVQRSSRRGED
jgi:hypothetical protein